MQPSQSDIASGQPGDLCLWGAAVIDGQGSRLDRATVTVRGGKIAAVSQALGDGPPAAAIDLRGRTLLPGLIDAHLHLSSDVHRSPGFGPPPPLAGEAPRPRELGYYVIANAARAMLRAGLTTVRDVGSYDDEALVLREAIRLGLVEGPRIFTCGRIISATAPGGRLFGTMYREADGPGEMRKAVREQVRRGADFIKCMATGARSVLAEDPEPAQLTRPELGSIVDEAHRLGLRVAAHAEGLDGVRLAVEEGVDTIEHGLSLHRDPSLLDAMARKRTVLVPTLSTFHDLAERFAAAFAPKLVEQAKRQLEEAYLTVGAALKAGVTLAMGYDSGPPGESALELVRMAGAGMSSMQAIEAATAGSAAALGLPDHGVIRPGSVADLVVVDANPLDDLGVLRDQNRVWLVIQEGRPAAGRSFAGN